MFADKVSKGFRKGFTSLVARVKALRRAVRVDNFRLAQRLRMGLVIDSLVDEARVRGIPGLEKRKDGPNETRAEKMFSTLSRLFSWLVDNRKLYRLRANPCATLKKPDAAPARDRVLTDAELAAFWAAADTVAEPFGALFKILLLTGARLRGISTYKP